MPSSQERDNEVAHNDLRRGLPAKAPMKYAPRLLLLTYDLKRNLQRKLYENNIKYSSELALLSNDELINQFGFTTAEVDEINSKIKFPTCTGFSFFDWQQQEASISTGCRGLDIALGGKGLPTGKLTQLSGEAGTGKSQICMQLCFRVQLEIENGGLDAEALYFETENSFRPERIQEIAFNYFKHFTEHNLLKFKAEEVLTRIHVRRVNTNVDDLSDIILNGELDSFFKYHSNVRLFVLDSIAYLFRYDYEYRNETRIRQLTQIATRLKQIAFDYNIAIILTNHVRLENAPTLGLTWNSLCFTSLLLNRIFNETNIEDDEHLGKQEATVTKRQCCILKSPNVPQDYCFDYYITPNGVEESSI